ncbi:flavin reductase (DIM6/NTAB) family NADH-FMN oxidoreductase RutF/DNA-binding IclR family transcriptional regulator [Arthrobacter ginsengisoli]|uniref:Flavin reductase (DIM6/NTAB) family NADH-FMN oxidoreductase RutF/DNA-binding IclR family transcriptional regulator n=1 Tax=Arthrobacter ginsengisoli TaxID=1356565 RepID=A0ABU1UIM6_9MICC|nr:flavin reductase [Arthrobacter ginsengisoli]MDR7085039.1 flavin reductase (DIM6/NTAB) family NADH-FMN oxidoreductase RutF/DNA-binding IclR family transcriptional regulator [Arthrobacter ginsengisoli]
MNVELDPIHFRQVLGQYPTGVAIVTAVSRSGEPIGMTVGSFSSVSLDPPLVAFMPDKNSTSWRALQDSGDRFCVNLLGADQENICRSVAVRKENKFADIAWRKSPQGSPLIVDSVAYIDCTIEAVHDVGDHNIVIGRVQDLAVENASYPLLFFRGGYGSFRPLSLAARDIDLLDQLRLIDFARPHMDELAHHFDSEVTVTTLLNDELVLAAAAGRARHQIVPRQVGQRERFRAPLGTVYAAWGEPALRERWIENSGQSATPEQIEEYRQIPDRVRDRGVAVSLVRKSPAPDGVSPARGAEAWYNPESLDGLEGFELRSVSAPVFDARGRVAFALTLWGTRGGPAARATVEEYIYRLLEACEAATKAVGEMTNRDIR